jgi:hypothetical protein
MNKISIYIKFNNSKDMHLMNELGRHSGSRALHEQLSPHLQVLLILRRNLHGQLVDLVDSLKNIDSLLKYKFQKSFT